MASEKGASRDGFDERLSQARDAALLEGEEIIAQEMGDQGQAVVVTMSRILILKAGLTATGTLNGLVSKAYTTREITGVKVRKGPMGAVIQICTEDNQHASQAGPPENIVIFSGDQRAKKCDSLAALIESTLGISVEKIEPKVEHANTPHEAPEAIAQVAVDESTETITETATEEPVEPKAEESVEVVRKPRGGRKAKSLAEEMFEEMTGTTQPEPVSEPVNESISEPKPAHVEPQNIDPPEQKIEPVIEALPIENIHPADDTPVEIPCEKNIVMETKAAEEMIASAYSTADQHLSEEKEEEQKEESIPNDFRPNPNLPKPMRKKGSGPNKALILLGGLMALVLVGVAVTAPLRQPTKTPSVEINVEKITRNAAVVRLQLNDINNYRKQIKELIEQSNMESAAISAALHSSNRQAVIAAGKSGTSDKAWRKLNLLDVPSGLAGSKESLVLGTFIRKNAVANALSVSPPDKQTTLSRFSEADVAIAKGLEMIDKMEKELSNQLAQSKPPTQTKKTDVKTK